MSRQLVVTCEHGRRLPHWVAPTSDRCEAQTILNLDNLPDSMIEAAAQAVRDRLAGDGRPPAQWEIDAAEAALRAGLSAVEQEG